MFLLENFKTFSKIFYWTGLAPSPTISRKQQNYIFLLSVIVSLLINIGFLVISVHFPSYKLYGNIEKIVSYTFVVSLILSNLSANAQCYYFKWVYGSINDRISKMETIFQTKFSQNIRSQTFARRYKTKVLVITIILSIVFTLKFGESWIENDYKSFVRYCFAFLAECLSSLVFCHVLLYISIVQLFITELNGRIGSTPIGLNSSSKMELLKTIKLLHMEIWKLMAQINTFFSFNLTFYMISLAVQTTYYLYWLFLIMQVEWNTLYITQSLVIIIYCLVRISLLVNGCQSLLTETTNLMEHTERHAFRTTNNLHLYLLKMEIQQQFHNFPIIVTADGYFNINRSFLAGVASNCCTYIVIFIQFFLEDDASKAS
ncbi:putative gustatory receptor 98c [Bradysia coprophila]|uniref:putative gustatory receptor 98c n=1 Tax=Bradysia coprophila TaxID=38358 RepID=UPI00187DD3DE|nr:putative gustatory receptor 98c [Bradysia coprophila]